MSIQLSVKAAGLNITANLRDEVLALLIDLIQKNRDESAPQSIQSSGSFPTEPSGTSESRATMGALTGHNNEQAVKDSLKQHSAAELLNRLKWDNYPEKILLLGAWQEARGGITPWRSADMDETFRQAKEKPPGNFPRDIRTAIKSGWIHPETPRTYVVTRSGWNKLGQALENLPQ